MKKINSIRGYTALVLITISACIYAALKAIGIMLETLGEYLIPFIGAMFCMPFMLIAFLLEPSMTKESIQDLKKL